MFHKMKKMSTRKLFTAMTVLVLVVLTASAQDEQWTLTECIDYALQANIQVQEGRGVCECG